MKTFAEKMGWNKSDSKVKIIIKGNMQPLTEPAEFPDIRLKKEQQDDRHRR